MNSETMKPGMGLTPAAAFLKAESEKPADLRSDRWWVFSTALQQGWLMVHHPKSGLTGTVRAPSALEWREAYSAPTNAYVWPDDSRVVVDDGRN